MNFKNTSLSQFASHSDKAIVGFGNCFNIKQAQSKALNIVYIAGWHPVQLSENVLLILGA